MFVNPNNVGEIANEMLANTHEPWGDLTSEMRDNWWMGETANEMIVNSSDVGEKSAQCVLPHTKRVN